MAKRERHVIAFLVATFVFILGVFIGSEISKSSLEDVKDLIQNDVLETQSLEIELSIIENINSSYLCGYIDYRLTDIIKSKVELGRRFELGDVKQEEAAILQKQYSISLAKYLLFTEVEEKRCGIDKPRIMFFFDGSETSREQGKVLDYLVYRTGENLTIFSFNVGWNTPLIKLLVSTYNATETPMLIIKNERFTGFQSKEKVAAELCKYYELGICR